MPTYSDEFLINLYFRGRHASKVTEEEEDEECLKEEEDGLSGAGNTRLVAQPSCECSTYYLQIMQTLVGFVVAVFIVPPHNS